MTPSPKTSLKRHPSLSQQVVDDLRQRIVNARLRPGVPLPSERELCEHYDVSRTVIREAVKVLEAKGIVRAVPGSGLIVAEPDLADVAESVRLFLRQGTSLRYDQLHEVRLSIETAVAGISAEIANEDQITRLYKLCDDLEAAEGDLIEASKIDYDFHRKIAELAGNELFLMLFDVLSSGLMETRIATFAMDGARFEIVAKAHRKIVEGIESGDRQQAIDAMIEHLMEVKETWDAHPEVIQANDSEPAEKLFGDF